MITPYQVEAEDNLKSKAFEQGAIYTCTDTRRIFFDPINGHERVLISGDPIILNTENDRINMLFPIADKLYLVIESRKMYIYHAGDWFDYNNGPNIHVDGERLIIE